jgi:outer membrane protein assembly factor BamA
LGSVFKIGFLYQSVEVEETPDRYISEPGAVDNPDIFNVQHFAGAEVSYKFKNLDVPVFPARGMCLDLLTGWKYNLNKPDKKFGYIIPSISFFYPLEGYGKVVLATKLNGRITIGDGYEIYQGAYIGGLNGLRGFRDERFNGKNSFYQNSDLRINIGKVRNNIFPMEYGIYGGFDYGRVWVENDTSDLWHTSYGGGLFINFSDFTLANASLFHSADGNRFQFAIGLNF